MTLSITGDPLTDVVLPPAMRLVWAVREQNPNAVRAAIDDAVTAGGDDGLHALIVVLAALVPDDQAPSSLLAWRLNPDEYHRLRQAGVGSAAAARLAAGGSAA